MVKRESLIHPTDTPVTVVRLDGELRSDLHDVAYVIAARPPCRKLTGPDARGGKMLRKVAASLLFGLALAAGGTASADGMPGSVKDAPVVAPTWSAFYIGAG